MSFELTRNPIRSGGGPVPPDVEVGARLAVWYSNALQAVRKGRGVGLIGGSPYAPALAS